MEEEKESIGTGIGIITQKVLKVVVNFFPGIRKRENKRLEKKVSKLNQKKKVLEKNIDLKKKNEELRERVKELKKDIQTLKNYETSKEEVPKEEVLKIQNKYINKSEKIITNDKDLNKENGSDVKLQMQKYKEKNKVLREKNKELNLRLKELKEHKEEKVKENNIVSLTDAIEKVKDKDNLLVTLDKLKGEIEDIKIFKVKDSIPFAAIKELDKQIPGQSEKIFENFLGLQMKGLIKVEKHKDGPAFEITQKGKDFIKNTDIISKQTQTSNITKTNTKDITKSNIAVGGR